MVAIEPVSEDSVLICFQGNRSTDISVALTQKILRYSEAIEKALTSVIRDLVPGYTTLLCVYDPARIDFRRVCAAIRTVSSELETLEAVAQGLGGRSIGFSTEPGTMASPFDKGRSKKPLTPNTVIIPVYYDLEVGPDLRSVAEQSDLTVDDVIRIHSSASYHVFAMGFCPGFAFLGPVDPAIALPRRETPRPKVPAGSVAIANRQTAVYPIESPGGWHLIGRSPVEFFSKKTLSLLQPGDQVQFQRISRQTYRDQGGHL